MKKIGLIGLMLCLGVWAWAQGDNTPGIQFEETTHDFGKMSKGAPAEHTFVFTNVTEAPIRLTRVKASCGCTTPKWTSDEVASDATGEIQVKYNTNRIGRFTKTVTVNYEEGKPPVILYIKGEVESDQTHTDARFPQRVGNTGFDRTSQNIGLLNSNETRTVSFQIKNMGPLPIQFTEEVDKEMMFEVKAPTQPLIPGQVGKIDIVIKGDRFLTFGQFSKNIRFYTSDKESPIKTINISGNINRVFSEQELADMPRIEFEQTEYDGGVVIEGEKVTYAYKFSNTGGSDLVIENVRASCGCTATAPKDKVVKPGQSSEILATFNSSGRRGSQQKSITVRSNDPENGTVVLRLKTTVESDPFHQEEVGPAATPGTNR